MRQTHLTVNQAPQAMRGSIPWLSTNSPVPPGNAGAFPVRQFGSAMGVTRTGGCRIR